MSPIGTEQLHWYFYIREFQGPTPPIALPPLVPVLPIYVHEFQGPPLPMATGIEVDWGGAPVPLPTLYSVLKL